MSFYIFKNFKFYKEDKMWIYIYINIKLMLECLIESVLRKKGNVMGL